MSRVTEFQLRQLKITVRCQHIVTWIFQFSIQIRRYFFNSVTNTLSIIFYTDMIQIQYIDYMILLSIGGNLASFVVAQDVYRAGNSTIV